jgi:hypothetical protein
MKGSGDEIRQNDMVKHMKYSRCNQLHSAM